VFTGDSPMHIVARHVNTAPAPPSKHSAHPVPALLDEIVLACLEKKPSARPTTARELCDRLGQCEVEPWTREDARQWWETRMEPETLVALVT
jgi:eukaryotic-like serine/threonine-protein kinase